MVKALARAVIKSAIQAAVVAAVAIALWKVEPRLSMLWAIASSGFLLLHSYGSEWRLSTLTCALPTLAAIGCIVIQSALLPAPPMPSALAPGLLLGLLLGIVSGRAHQVTVKQGLVFARRSAPYLIVWMITTILTQGLALFDLKDLVSLGLAGGLFSTAMVSAASVVLFRKYRAELRKLRSRGNPPSPPGAGPVLRTAAYCIVILVASMLASPTVVGQLNVTGFNWYYKGDVLLAESKFGTRLPTDEEIQRSVARALPDFRKLGAAPFEGSVTQVLRDEIDDPRLLKVHKTSIADPVKSSYLLLLVTRRYVVRYSVVAPGFGGAREQSGDFSRYFVAFMYEESPGWFIFVDQYVDRFDSEAERNQALSAWMTKYGLDNGFGDGSRTVSPAQRTLDLSDPRAIAALASTLLLLLMSLGINLSQSVTQTLLQATRLGSTPPATAEPLLIDPETGEPLIVQDGRYEGGRLGEVWFDGRWMSRGEAEYLVAQQAENKAERRQWFDERTSQWEAGVRQKIEKENLEIDPYTGAWRHPLDPEPRPESIPRESGDASRPDIDFGLSGVEITHKRTEARLTELAGLKERAAERYEDARHKYEEALATGDRWLADKLRERVEHARGHLDDVESAERDLHNRVAQREVERRKFQEGIEKVGLGDVLEDLFINVPYQLYESWKDDSAFVETMKGAIAARNRLQDIMDEAGGLYVEHTEALDRLHDVKLRIDEARRNGDKGLEAHLREEAGPLKAELERIQNALNEIHESKRQWERRASEANLAAYTKSTDIILAGTETPEMAGVVNRAIDWYRRRSIPGKTMGDSGWTIGDKRSIRERELDADHFISVQRGNDRYMGWLRAHESKAVKEATVSILEDYQAKAQMKSKASPLQRRFAADVETYRDKPLFRGMADECNARGYVTEDRGVRRSVTSEDFSKVTSSKTRAPGQDLDVKHARIIDPKTGKPADFRELQRVADSACERLGFDPVKQEIKVVGGPAGSTHVESMPIKTGHTADTMYSPSHLRRYDSYDAGQAYRVSEVKAADSGHLGPADRLSEACRTSVKDYKRVSQTLMDTREGAVAHAPFNDRAIKVMEAVGNGVLPPGTGNRRFRDLTGMDLDAGCEKLNSLQETVVTLDPSKVSKQSLVDELGLRRPGAGTRGEAYADLVSRGDRPRLPDRALPGAEPMTPEMLGSQKWPESLGSVQAGTLKMSYEGGEAWWPLDEHRIPYLSIKKKDLIDINPAYMPEEHRWLIRERELGLLPPASTPLNVAQDVLGTKRSRDMEAFVSAHPDFGPLDNQVRGAYFDALHLDDENPGVDVWTAFQTGLANRKVAPEQYEAWCKAVMENKWQPRVDAPSVVLPGAGRKIVNGQGEFGTKIR